MNTGSNDEENMNEIIIRFIEGQTCTTICCVDETKQPYCFCCFYAFDPGPGLIYFKSSSISRHVELMKKVPFVAGTVLPDKLNTFSIKGIQYDAVILDSNDPVAAKSVKLYLKKFPMAIAIPGAIYVLQINNIKMTDSTFGIAKKIAWNRNQLTP